MSVRELPPTLVESLSKSEQRVSFRVGDSWCRANSLDLRSGVRLGVKREWTLSAALA